jgi:hypothetical protein
MEKQQNEHLLVIHKITTSDGIEHLQDKTYT